MKSKKKNIKKIVYKIVYKKIFIKKFFENLSGCLTNYSYKRSEEKLNKDEKQNLSLVSYKKLKLLNKVEIITKLIFLKKDYLN